MSIQAFKAQKVAYGHLQNHTCKLAIALSKELCEAANVSPSVLLQNASQTTVTLTRNQMFLADE